MQLIFRVGSAEIGNDAKPVIKWSRDSKYVAIYGNNNVVLVYDKNGAKLSTIPVANPKIMDWDAQSKILIITSANSNEITLHYMPKRDTMPIEAPFVPTWGQCSRRGSFLVVGSEKGMFWICDLNSRQSQSYQGTHDSAIVGGIWNSKGHICLCSEDQSISVSDMKGKVLARLDLGDVPIFPQFVTVDSTPTVAFTTKNTPTLYFWDYLKGKEPQKVTLDPSLGTIVRSGILTNGLVFIQFSFGKFVLVNFEYQQVLSRHAFSSSASAADIIRTTAIVGNGASVKVINIDDPKDIMDDQIRFPDNTTGTVCSIAMSPDGSLTCVGLTDSSVLIYLVEVPILAASSGPLAVYSQSLTSLTVYDMHKKSYRSFSVESQPQKIGVCLKSVAVAFNNNVWFYDTKTLEQTNKAELSGTIDDIQVSDSAYAVMLSGKVMLNYFDSNKKPFSFPDFDTASKVTAFSLTGFLLLLATDDGTLRIFNTRNQAYLDGYKHPNAIVSIQPNLSETRFVFIDSAHGVYFFNPIKRTAVPILEEGSGFDAVASLFDITDRNVFAVIAPKKVSIYHMTDQNYNGQSIRKLCEMEIPTLKVAIGVSNGTIIFIDSTSQEKSVQLTSHQMINEEKVDSVRELIAINRHRQALQIAIKLQDKTIIKEVAEAALDALNIEIAQEAFIACGEANVANQLEPVLKEEELSYLRGYVAMMRHDFNAAQKYFMESSRPQMTLDMRSALLQFDSALQLAEKFDPTRIPYLSYESARQNELTGNYAQAFQQYKNSLTTSGLKHQSRAGIIRCLIYTGKVEQGMKQLEKTKDVNLVTECARILEKLSAFLQAAQLYVQVQQYNSAAQCYLRANELNAAAELCQKVDDVKVLRSVGKQLERAGQLEGAASAFEKGSEWESLVRVLLKINLDRATSVARQHPTVQACRLVAEHCINLGNFRYAIEFLIISGQSEDAFRIAELHNRMDELADLIGNHGTVQQYEAIGNYFAGKSDQLNAAKFFALAKDPHRAMNCYMADGSPAALDGALELAEKVPDKNLRDGLLEYLTANMKADDLRYLLRMFIIMEHFDEAAVTALRISDTCRSRGDYKQARSIIFDIVLQLMNHGFAVSAEMKQSLMIIHSYSLIKEMKDRDRVIEALLLRRVSKYASKFPTHAPQILAKTVAECTRAGFKKSAYEAATKLIAPEYEGRLAPDLMKKIVATVRRKVTTEEEEPKTPCPVCGTALAISELYCSACKTNIPFDSLTGMHMAGGDWCECPKCRFPASHKLMCELKTCPLCNEHIETPVIIQNPRIL